MCLQHPLDFLKVFAMICLYYAAPYFLLYIACLCFIANYTIVAVLFTMIGCLLLYYQYCVQPYNSDK